MLLGIKREAAYASVPILHPEVTPRLPRGDPEIQCENRQNLGHFPDLPRPERGRRGDLAQPVTAAPGDLSVPRATLQSATPR